MTTNVWLTQVRHTLYVTSSASLPEYKLNHTHSFNVEQTVSVIVLL